MRLCPNLYMYVTLHWCKCKGHLQRNALGWKWEQKGPKSAADMPTCVGNTILLRQFTQVPDTDKHNKQNIVKETLGQG